jgi:hypothetical protein
VCDVDPSLEKKIAESSINAFAGEHSVAENKIMAMVSAEDMMMEGCPLM